ncbi:hypothetical protein LSH36_60g00016 [Paralvinella palmiformis]|uniref:Uncharacterized protein n=1 Tax=Paralvinella palmiformis TaxID=53620 RepID=A0AAD9NBY9_9ANNE|nr:hypothetical protein LSH36_60g00016 [Paralvinella palmiformis]
MISYNSRPGPIPFYGGFAKRSGPQTDYVAGQLSTDPDNEDLLPTEKRTFNYCQCCLRSPALNWYCCQNCNLIPFYGGFKKRSPEKRGYETSFVPLELSGVGICERCCSGPTFDFYCCVFQCGEKRRR